MALSCSWEGRTSSAHRLIPDRKKVTGRSQVRETSEFRTQDIDLIPSLIGSWGETKSNYIFKGYSASCFIGKRLKGQVWGTETG